MPARSPSEDLGRSLWVGAVLPEKRAMSSHPRPRATRVRCDGAGDLPVTLERSRTRGRSRRESRSDSVPSIDVESLAGNPAGTI